MTAPLDPPSTDTSALPRRIDLGFMLQHPAHLLALGFGSGLSPKAPGTAGTALAWLGFVLLDPWIGTAQWAGVLLGSAAVGWWACTVTARHAGVADPGSIVWDEILAFWFVLWMLTPASLSMQAVAFGLFRFFDAAKPGPVRWADQQFKGLGWRGGFGILFDDLVAALCTLAVLAVLILLWPDWH